MGAVVSCCRNCCYKNSDKYNANSGGTYAAGSSNNAYDNKIHVSEIYGNNADDGLVPSDNPTTSTYFGSILYPPKERSQQTPVEDEPSPAQTNPQPLAPRISLSPGQSRYRKSELSRPLTKFAKHSNSCSTIYVDDSTVSQPNCKAMIKCVSIAIHSHIVHRKSNKTMSIFDEKLHPLSKERVPDDYETVNPDQKIIYRFLRTLFTAAQLTAECAIVTLVYLERVLSYGELDLCPSNWRRLVLGAVMLASKVWDDQAVWNVDFCQILRDISVSEMNELEREYVQLLQFNVNVASSIYAKYYFDLRQIANENQISFPDELLTKEKAIKLEALSLANTRIENHSIEHTSQTSSTDAHLSSSQRQALAPLLSLRRSASVELGQPSRKSLLIIS